MKKLYLLFTLCLALLGFTKANAETTLVSCDAGLGEILFTTEVVEIPATTENITFKFSDEIKSVEALILQSQTGNGEIIISEDDYWYYGNELSLTLPLEQTLVCKDLTIIMQVFDKNDEPITFTNHSNPGYSAPNMIFVEFALTPVEPTIVEFSPEPGEIKATEKSIYLSFNTEIAEVEVAKLESTSGEMPELVLDSTLWVWGKDISIILPLEKTAKASDLKVVLKVKDIQGKYATYGEEEGMVNLAYTLVPVTPTVEDCGAVNQTITNATSSIEIMFSTPIAKVNQLILSGFWGGTAVLEEGTGYTIYDNILTVNLPAEFIEQAASLPEEYKAFILGVSVEDIQGKTVIYSNSMSYPQEAAEQMGMTFLEYKIATVTKVTALDPACGFYDVLPSEIKITFDAPIQTVEYGMIQTQLTGFRGYMMEEKDYAISSDSLSLTVKVPEEFLVDQSQMQIRMNVVDAKGMYVTYAFDPDYEYEDAVILEYTAPVKADLYKMVSSDPAEGEVEKLDVINVAFADAFESVAGGFDPSKQVSVINALGNVVATATMEVVSEEADEYGWAPATNVVKFTLDTPVTTAGVYTFVIPAGTVYNELFYPEAEDFGVEWGAVYNPEIRIEYIVVPADGIEEIMVAGKSEIYTLDGKKVSNNAKSGIYLINGKKVYVK